MKTAQFLITLTFTISFWYASSAKDLLSSLKDQSIKAVFERSTDTVRLFDDCIAIKGTLTNLSQTDLLIDVYAGTHLLAADTSVQNMLVVDAQIVALKKGESKVIMMHAYCTNHTLAGPSDGELYVVNKMPDSKLQSIGKFIASNKYYGQPAQAAVWVFSDNEPLTTIYDDDESTVMALRNFAGKELGKAVPKFGEALVGREQLQIIDTAYYSGKIWFSMPMTGKASLVLYAEDGSVLRSLCNFDALKAGEYTYNFHITDAELNGRKAHFELNLMDMFKREIKLTTYTAADRG